jgi:hypothetical protein
MEVSKQHIFWHKKDGHKVQRKKVQHTFDKANMTHHS